MKVDASRLSLLFEGVADAAEQGDVSRSLRLADCARRYAPDHPTAQLVYARSLLQGGDARATLEFLRGRPDRDSRSLSAEAALAAGLLDEAVTGCIELLARYAVDSVPGLAALATRVTRAAAERYPGWVGVDSRLRLVGELNDTEDALIDWGGASLHRLRVSAGAPGFAQEIPSLSAGVITVFAGGGAARAERPLLGSGIVWPLNFRAAGWVVLERRDLQGEVRLDWDSSAPLTVVLGPGRGETRLSVEPPAFSWLLDDLDLDRPELDVRLVLPDGRLESLAGSPIKLPLTTPKPIEWVPPPVTVPVIGRTSTTLINVVIPVYAGREATQSCLRSVIATTSPRVAAITVVDDATPDGELRESLEALARRGRITLLRNPVNLGFPGAVNRGMRALPDRDVVLLNADTEVFPGWLERLRAVAYGHEKIGTVTPLGEQASIVSYGTGAAPLSSAAAARIDRIARAVHAERAVDIPVGVGFCLYIRRICLEETGEFDEQAFGRGYGEENDFCLRARRRGWRHVAATGVFVRHAGGASFGPAKALLSRRNHRVINYRHPGYDELIEEFSRDTELELAKRAIDQQLVLDTASRPVLLVSLELGGGVKRHVNARREALRAAGHTVLLLRADTRGDLTRAGAVRLEAEDVAHLVYQFAGDGGADDGGAGVEAAALREFLGALRLQSLEIHHFLGMPGAVLELLVALGVRYEVVIHDYTWVCPRVSMLNGRGMYCGEPELAACERCVKENGSALAEPLTVADLRARSSAVLAAAARVVVPTRDVATRLARYFPGLAMAVEPWEGAPPPDEVAARVAARARARRRRLDGAVRVLLLGAIGTQKGYSILLDCARDAVVRSLPLEFVIVGYSSHDPPLVDTGRVFMTGPYEERELPALLEREGCDVAWFPTVGPETWCYTLTVALAESMPIVAFDLGAVAERLREAGMGSLLPLDTPAEALNDELLRMAAANSLPEPASPTLLGNQETSMDQSELSATVQVLTLPVGLYCFTVQAGAAVGGAELMLPALQVAPAPVRSPGRVEFLCGPSTLDRWLTAHGDVITVKITGGEASLLLTSLRNGGSEVLSIDVRQLDAPAVTVATSGSDAASAELAAAGAAAAVASDEIRVITLVHVPYLGDLTFVEGWAGKPADNLWIEGFSILVEEPALPELVEYCGITEEGDITDWMSGGELCGARGTGVPLVAFALRIRAGGAADGYVVRYQGRFLSGAVVGPFDDGRFCRSEAPGDPLVAMDLVIQRV